MAEDKVIFKNGFLYKEVISENLKIKKLEMIVSNELRGHYDDEVIFDEGLTVEKFMDTLMRFENVIDNDFKAYSRGFELGEYYKQMRLPSERDDNDTLTIVEFYWTSEINEDMDLASGKLESDFYYYGCYHALCNEEDVPSYGLSLSPINNWKHLPIVLNNEFKCTIIKEDPIRYETVFESTKKWTLHDVIRHFIFELTWYGYPEDVKAVVDDLNERSYEIEQGTAETVSLDLTQMQIETLEEMKKEELEKQNYKGVQRIQDKIDKLKSKKTNDD